MKCRVCGHEMNPVEAMLTPTCGVCCRLIHKYTTKGLTLDAAKALIKEISKPNGKGGK